MAVARKGVFVDDYVKWRRVLCRDELNEQVRITFEKCSMLTASNGQHCLHNEVYLFNKLWLRTSLCCFYMFFYPLSCSHVWILWKKLCFSLASCFLVLCGEVRIQSAIVFGHVDILWKVINLILCDFPSD